MYFDVIQMSFVKIIFDFNIFDTELLWPYFSFEHATEVYYPQFIPIEFGQI